MESPRIVSCQRLARMALVAFLLASAPAVAVASPESDFKKAARAAAKRIAALSKSTTKTVKSDLKTAAAGYGAGGLDAAAALAQAVGSVTAQRDALLDAALTEVTGLAAAGATILRDAGTLAPGADFQAGGRGTWDDTVAAVDSILGASDDQVAAAFAKFAGDMTKGAKKRDAVADVRFRVPSHDGAIRAVEPPAVGARALRRELDRSPAQILIAARMAETNSSFLLELGVRFDGPSVGVVASSTASETSGLGTLNLGGGGTATGSFLLAPLANPDSFVRVVLDAAAESSTAALISAPRITSAPDGTAAIVKEFGVDLSEAGKSLSGSGRDALALLALRLASHVAAVGRGQASAQRALETGWTDLRNAREAIALAFQQAHADPVAAVRSALSGGGFGDDDLTADFAPDAPGVYGAAAAAMAATLAKSQDAATRQYEAFVAKILGLAKKQKEAIGANLVVGRMPDLAAPMVTTAASPPSEVLTHPEITDGLVLRVKPAVGPDGFTVLLILQTDPVRFPQVITTAVTIPDGTSAVLGTLVSGPGGTSQSQVPILGDLPVLGWLFRAKAAADTKSSLLILTKPTLVTSDE